MKRTWNAGKVVAVLIAAMVLMTIGSAVAWAAAGADPDDNAYLGSVEAQKPKTGCITDPDQISEMNTSILNHIEMCGGIHNRTIKTDIIKAIDEKLVSAHADACSADATGSDTIYACGAMKNFAYVALFTDYKQKGKCYSSVLKTVDIVNTLRKEVCPKGGKRSDKAQQASGGDTPVTEGAVAEGDQTGPKTPETSGIPGGDGSGEEADAGSFSNEDGCALVPGAGASAASALALLLWLAPIAVFRRRGQRG